MASGIEELKAGNFDTMFQERQPDDTLTITLTKRGAPTAHIFNVTDLYGPGETVNWDQEVPT